jgi:hypothetical protein
MYLSGYEYDPGNGAWIPIPAWQVCHFKGWNPDNEFIGMSDTVSISVDAHADINASRWNAKLYGKSNARLPGLMSFADNITDGDWTQIQDDINKSAEKNNIMLLRNVGQGGVTWQQAAATLKDMEFSEGRQFTKEEIFGLFAPGLSSVLAINATEANSKTGKATLAEFVVWPMLTTFAEKITAGILTSYGDNLVAEFDDPRISDRAMELQEISTYAQTHTIDEIRKEYYQDEPISKVTGIDADERGVMLPAQISPTTPVPSDEPEPEPPVVEVVTQTPAPPMIGEEAVTETPVLPAVEGNETITPTIDDAIKTDLRKWRNKAEYYLRHGKGERKTANVEFTSKAIPDELYQAIKAQLATAQTVEDIGTAFAVEIPKAKAERPPEQLVDAAAQLLHEIRLSVEQLAND